MMRILAVLCAAALAGCAGVSVQALTPDGLHASGQPGLRYYMPRPYLLVTEAPPVANSGAPHANDVVPDDAIAPDATQQSRHAGRTVARNTTSAGTNHQRVVAGGANTGATGEQRGTSHPASPQQPAATTDASANDAAKTGKGDDNAVTAPAAGTDTSYQQTLGNYQVKLVYLPDLGRPMSIQLHAGLFGTASAQPTLVNGWMLTSLQSSAENHLDQVLTAFGSLYTATHSGGAAAGGATHTAAGGHNERVELAPGLYAFEYDATHGVLTGLCLATPFTASAANPVPPCANRLLSQAANWGYVAPQ